MTPVQEVRLNLIDPEDTANEVWRIDLDHGGVAIYKPVIGEHPAFDERRLYPRGALALGEVTGWQVDRLFGFGLVPPTVWWDGPRGLGSLQLFAPGVDGPATRPYSRADRERMAVLDYLIANTDRLAHNYRTSPGGRPVAIDNGNSFPRAGYPLVSDFFVDRLGRPLSAPVLAQVRAVRPAELVRVVVTAGQPSELAVAAGRRLLEIQHRGMITGEEWDAGLEGVDGTILPRSDQPEGVVRRALDGALRFRAHVVPVVAGVVLATAALAWLGQDLSAVGFAAAVFVLQPAADGRVPRLFLGRRRAGADGGVMTPEREV